MNNLNLQVTNISLKHLNYGLVIAEYPIGAIHNKVGSTHFIEHLLCRNNKDFFVQGATKKDNMILWTKAPKIGLEDTIQKFLNINKRKPSLEEFQQEKVIINDEILIKNLNKEYRYLEQLNRINFEKSEYGNSIIGQVSDLNNIELSEIHNIIKDTTPSKLFLIGPWLEENLNSIKEDIKPTTEKITGGNNYGIRSVYRSLGFIGGGIKLPGENQYQSDILEVVKRILLFRIRQINPIAKTRVSIYKQYLYLIVYQKENLLSKEEIEVIFNELQNNVSKKEYSVGIYLLKRDINKLSENLHRNIDYNILSLKKLPTYNSVYRYFSSYNDITDLDTSLDISTKKDTLPTRQTLYLKNRNEYINIITSPLTKRFHILCRFETHDNLLSKKILIDALKGYSVEEIRYEGTQTIFRVVINLGETVKYTIIDVISSVLKIESLNQKFDKSAHTEIKKSLVDNLVYSNNKDYYPVFKGVTICTPSNHNINIKELEYSLLNTEQLLSNKDTKLPIKITKSENSNNTILLSKLPCIAEASLLIQEAAHGSHELKVKSLQQRIREKFGKYYFVQNILKIKSDFYIFWAVKGKVDADSLIFTVKEWLKDLQKNILHLKNWYLETNSYIDPRNHISIITYMRDVDRKVYYVRNNKPIELYDYIQRLVDNEEIIIN